MYRFLTVKTFANKEHFDKGGVGNLHYCCCPPSFLANSTHSLLTFDSLNAIIIQITNLKVLVCLYVYSHILREDFWRIRIMGFS